MKQWMAVICTTGAVLFLGLASVSPGAEPPKDTSPRTDAGTPRTESPVPGPKAPLTVIKGLKVLPDSLLKSIPRAAHGLIEKYRGSMPEYRPDPNTKYTLLVMKPDPGIDYKIRYFGDRRDRRPENSPEKTPGSGAVPPPAGNREKAGTGEDR